MKRSATTGLVLLVALALNGLGASPAAATPPLACYKAVHDEFGVTGNYKNTTCTEKTAVLKGEYVLAEPLSLLKEDIWCAKMAPVVGPPGTGQYENSTCTKRKENGEYTEVISAPLPEFSVAAKASGTSGELELSLEGAKITCKQSKDTLGAGVQSGTFKFDIDQCKLFGEECRGLGQPAEMIEALGEWHLVSQKANRKSYALWLLFGASDSSVALHFECAGILYLLWGNLLGSIEPAPGTSERTFQIKIETEGSGATLKQRVSAFGNNNDEAVKAELRGLSDDFAERAAFENSSVTLLFMEKATGIKES
jgi:hypothetical protein